MDNPETGVTPGTWHR